MPASAGATGIAALVRYLVYLDVALTASHEARSHLSTMRASLLMWAGSCAGACPSRMDGERHSLKCDATC
eukprot:6863428-Pyramimonas_sp.AAC.1